MKLQVHSVTRTTTGAIATVYAYDASSADALVKFEGREMAMPTPTTVEDEIAKSNERLEQIARLRRGRR